MKILIVCSGNVKDGDRFELVNQQPFIHEQTESLKKLGVEFDFFFISGKRVSGYLSNLPLLNAKIRQSKCDIIHAHYGLSGFLAVLQRKCPVVTSFIGEMNVSAHRPLSMMAARLSAYNIFVSEQLKTKSGISRRYSIIPYGVDMEVFHPIDKAKAREEMGLAPDKKYCLFSSSRDRAEKNFQLAKQAVDMAGNIGNIEIIELMKGYTRSEVNSLINASDFVLLTSFFEGSPQVIKEAMACNCPIISTNVGDVGKVIRDTDGCYITSFDPADVAKKIEAVLCRNERTNGRENIRHLEIGNIALRILDIYKKIT